MTEPKGAVRAHLLRPATAIRLPASRARPLAGGGCTGGDAGLSLLATPRSASGALCSGVRPEG